MYYHSRKNWLRYKSFPKSDVCPFCDPTELKPRVIRETKHALIMPNRIAYDQWENRKVINHLLLFPKEHTVKLAQLSPDVKLDTMHILGEYEERGYEIYLRSHINIQRSQGHLHFHLIKAETKRKRAMIFLFKPYILWRFG